ncbi:hypothetical protein OF83DRAFT_1119451 [Amylostereum chailletii]|nr:hypothetical protein OF83DRAFT_1119451 [Amylostereum chailletii]
MDWDRDDDEDDEDEDEDAAPGIQTPLRADDVSVKQESLDDVGGMLDAWEDIDNRLRVIQVVKEAVANVGPLTLPGIKIEEIDGWDFDDYGAPSPRYDSDAFGDFEPRIKEEDEEQLFVPSLIVGSLPKEDDFEDTMVCGSPLTPLPAESVHRSPSVETEEMRWGSFSSLGMEAMMHEGKRRPSELQWQDAEILGLDSILPDELEEGGWTARPREEVELDIALGADEDGGRSSRALSEAPSPSPDSPSADSDDTEDGPGPSTPPPLPIPALLPVSMGWGSPASLSEGSIDPLRLPASVRVLEKTSAARDEEAVGVMSTCDPCEPAISAIQVAGVEVYQMTVAGVRLLRRIDSDFVNVTALAAALEAAVPPVPPTGVDVVRGADEVVDGTWVPLTTASAFAGGRRREEAPDGLDAFLAVDLHARFPNTLQAFHREKTRQRASGRFGPPFARARGEVGWRSVPEAVEMEVEPWEGGEMEEEEEGRGLHVDVELAKDVESPLSPTEEAMFQTLCRISDWETPGGKEEKGEERKGEPAREAPLRRSKRTAVSKAVAQAIAPRRRGAKRGGARG